METTASPWQVGLKYGLIMGLISAVTAAINYSTKLFLNQGASLGLSVISLVITIVIFVLACREFKSQNGGFMKLGQGFMTGFWATVISSLIGAAFIYVWLTVVDPTIMDQIKENTAAQFAQQGLSDEQIEQAMSFSSMTLKPGFMAGSVVLAGIIFGAILALIVAAIMKKEPPEFV
jgi:hypothetical protein